MGQELAYRDTPLADRLVMRPLEASLLEVGWGSYFKSARYDCVEPIAGTVPL